LVLSAWTIRA